MRVPFDLDPGKSIGIGDPSEYSGCIFDPSIIATSSRSRPWRGLRSKYERNESCAAVPLHLRPLIVFVPLQFYSVNAI